MKKIIIASAALLGFAGAAFAQDAGVTVGDNYFVTADTTHAYTHNRSFETSGISSLTTVGVNGFNINQSEDYSGK